jgi:transcriptional regulator with XRE-family HTH domain
MNTQRQQKIARRVGRTIAARRMDAGFTQEQVAESLGVTQETVSRMERGLYEPPPSRLTELGELFGCDPAEFLHRLSNTPTSAARAMVNMIVGLSANDREHVLDLVANVTAYLRSIRRSKRSSEG